MFFLRGVEAALSGMRENPLDISGFSLASSAIEAVLKIKDKSYFFFLMCV